MKARTMTYVSWLSVLGALCAWTLVAYFGWTITEEQSAHSTQIANAQESTLRQAASARTHALVADTAEQHQALESFLQADVISVAGLIRAAGSGAGVDVEVSNALPEAASPAQSSGAAPVSAIGYVVQAQGSFAALMRALELFETLPVPASVQRFDIERASGPSAGAQWHMSLYLRVLTTAPVSS